MIYILLSILALVLYLIFFTPYPFVWMIRRQKSSGRSKSPENIDALREKVNISLGLTYPSKYKKNTYDVYDPKYTKADTTILWLHGGSFVAGNSSGMRNYGPMLGSEGYRVISMNYVLAPEKNFPTQLIQIHEMIAYIQKEYPTKHLVLGGDSAGANIVAMYAAMYKNDDLKNKVKIQLDPIQDVDQLILFCGAYDFGEEISIEKFGDFKRFMKYIGWSYLGSKSWEKKDVRFDASPYRHVDKNYPKTYITDGKKYSFMWQGIKMVEKLNRLGVTVKSRFYEEMVHEFQFDFEKHPLEAFEVYDDVLNFLKGVDNV